MLLNLMGLLMILTAHSKAGDSWLCTEDSTQVQGSRVLACGVGEHAKESVARQAAFNSAVQEFNSVCGTHTICGQHKYRVQPSRSTCEKEDGVWKCYRAVVYEVETDFKEIVPAVSEVKWDRGMDAALISGIGRGW